MMESCTLILLRRAPESTDFDPGSGLVDLVESNPVAVETQTPELSKT